MSLTAEVARALPVLTSACGDTLSAGEASPAPLLPLAIFGRKVDKMADFRPFCQNVQSLPNENTGVSTFVNLVNLLNLVLKGGGLSLPEPCF